MRDCSAAQVAEALEVAVGRPDQPMWADVPLLVRAAAVARGLRAWQRDAGVLAACDARETGIPFAVQCGIYGGMFGVEIDPTTAAAPAEATSPNSAAHGSFLEAELHATAGPSVSPVVSPAVDQPQAHQQEPHEKPGHGMEGGMAHMLQQTVALLQEPHTFTGRFESIQAFRRPRSPAVIIAPWNVPLGTIAPKLLVALLAGCSTIVKPSERAPSSIARAGHLMHAAIVAELTKHEEANDATADPKPTASDGARFVLAPGAAAQIAAGAVQIVLGGGQVGQRLVESPLAACVQFTGTARTAATVAREGASTLRPLLAECGGSNCAIVCADADIRGAVRYVAMGLLTLNGQWCMGISRILVHASIAGRFVQRLQAYLNERAVVLRSAVPTIAMEAVSAAVEQITARREASMASSFNAAASGSGDGEMGATVASAAVTAAEPLLLGPLAFEQHAAGLREIVAASKAASVVELLTPAQMAGVGAEPNCTCAHRDNQPAQSSGTFFPPTLLVNPAVVHAAAGAELFGPLAYVHTFTTDAAAIRLANLTRGQLAAYIFSENVESARRIGYKLNACMAMINSVNFGFEPSHPGEEEPPIDFTGTAGSGADGTPRALVGFFTTRLWCGVNGEQDHDAHAVGTDYM
jgi:acyl-CoA reductase-like NAD-dependent aldehyde dehydrogenase